MSNNCSREDCYRAYIALFNDKIAPHYQTVFTQYAADFGTGVAVFGYRH